MDEDVYDLLEGEERMSLHDLEPEIAGSGVDPMTCVDRFVELNGDQFFITND